MKVDTEIPEIKVENIEIKNKIESKLEIIVDTFFDFRSYKKRKV